MPRRHVLKQGECLQLLAITHGLGGGARIYEAPENEALRKKRRSVEAVAPGDTVVIPDRGTWQRLTNLGYWSGSEPPEKVSTRSPTAPAGRELRDPLVLALRAFQNDEGLEESGRLDEDTRHRLVVRHGI